MQDSAPKTGSHISQAIRDKLPTMAPKIAEGVRRVADQAPQVYQPTLTEQRVP